MAAVDTDKLHKLFMSGMRIAEIASEFGITTYCCEKHITKQRKMNPEAWPLRKQSKIENEVTAKTHRTYMHQYECTDCFVIFTIEDYEGIDHSATVCPICHCDENLEDAGYGYFVKTKEPETVN